MKTFELLKESLGEVLSTQATSYDYLDTLNFIWDRCEELGAEVYWDESHNLYATKGIVKNEGAYPCVVCHTDTVHNIHKGYKVFESNDKYFAMDLDTMNQVGVGGDDKVGIWVALEMLAAHENIKVAFFSQEEIGCVGSSQADEDFFKDVGYVFECDRKGSTDFVNESSGMLMFGDEFEKIITKTLNNRGYGITTGGLTDVHEISQIANVACANMSCGYYNPHSDTEYVDINHAVNTLRLVDDLINLLGEVKHEHKAVDSYGYSSYGYGTYSGYGTTKPKASKGIQNFSGCDMCGAISTNGCDFCNYDDAPQLDNDLPHREYGTATVEPCACGDTYRIYGEGTHRFKHCNTCGHYSETSV
jgi:hypothetical protein